MIDSPSVKGHHTHTRPRGPHLLSASALRQRRYSTIFANLTSFHPPRDPKAALHCNLSLARLLLFRVCSLLAKTGQKRETTKALSLSQFLSINYATISNFPGL